MNVWIQNPFDNLPLEGFRKQRFWLMAEAFARAGHRAVLWTADFNHMTKAPRKFAAAPVETQGVPAVGLRLVPTPPYSKNVSFARIRSHLAYAAAWKSLARKEAVRPDLIVASTPTVSGAEAAIRLGREFGAKVVIDVMDAWPETFERLAPRGLGWLAHLALSPLRRRARRVYRDADLVTGVCERYRALTGRTDYHLAYHGIELSPLQTPCGRPLAREGCVRLAYAGNLGETYDLGTAIRALTELDATLDIAGRGQGEAAWKDLVRRLGLERRVTFHGYLDEGALRQLLANCDVGLVPMAADSFVGVPYKFADYAAAGLRIASSLGGESSELLKRFRCGADYAPGDVAGFAAAVRRVSSPDTGDVDGLRQAFDATRIYDDYVRRTVTLCEPSNA